MSLWTPARWKIYAFCMSRQTDAECDTVAPPRTHKQSLFTYSDDVPSHSVHLSIDPIQQFPISDNRRGFDAWNQLTFK